jgi:hypothetical protein
MLDGWIETRWAKVTFRPAHANDERRVGWVSSTVPLEFVITDRLVPTSAGTRLRLDRFLYLHVESGIWEGEPMIDEVVDFLLESVGGAGAGAQWYLSVSRPLHHAAPRWSPRSLPITLAG